ncbi:MAG: hypothetical protein ACI8PT_004232, partial [Gammaproteobacteria bacterium]
TYLWHFQPTRWCLSSYVTNIATQRRYGITANRERIYEPFAPTNDETGNRSFRIPLMGGKHCPAPRP